ncbi:MAG: hypothetical protein AABZ61_04710, partial [Bacteroidota bacterium]
ELIVHGENGSGLVDDSSTTLGVDRPVGTRREVGDLGEKEARRAKGRIAPTEVQLTLFEMRDDRLREEIKKLDLEKMTPIEALQKLAELKKRLEK